MATLDQHVRTFLSERRLSDDEVIAVLKLAKSDLALGNLSWGASVSDFHPRVLAGICDLVRVKVLAWMNKYRSNHPARALFTGES